MPRFLKSFFLLSILAVTVALCGCPDNKYCPENTCGAPPLQKIPIPKHHA